MSSIIITCPSCAYQQSIETNTQTERFCPNHQDVKTLVLTSFYCDNCTLSDTLYHHFPPCQTCLNERMEDYVGRNEDGEFTVRMNTCMRPPGAVAPSGACCMHQVVFRFTGDPIPHTNMLKWSEIIKLSDKIGDDLAFHGRG